MISFRYKTIIGIASIEAVLLAILLSNVLSYMRISNEEQLQNRAQTTVRLFVTTTKDAVISYDLASLESFVDEIMTNPGMVYVRVSDVDNNVLAERSTIDLNQHNMSEDTNAASVDDSIYDTGAMIHIDGTDYGRVQIGLDITTLKELESQAKEHGMILAGIEMGLVALFSFILGYYLTRQLSELTQAAGKMAEGNVGLQVPVRGNDELAQTAMAFNHMSTELRKDLDQLRLNEQALNESRERMSNTLKIIGEGLWDWDIKNNRVTHNQRWCDMLNLGDKYLEHDVDFFVDCLHLQDRDEVIKKIYDALDHDEEYTSKHRLLTSDKREIWVLDRGRVVERSPTGEALRMIGSMRDLTERKRLEELVSVNQDNLEKVLAFMPLPCAVFNRDEWLWMNKKFSHQCDTPPRAKTHQAWPFSIDYADIPDLKADAELCLPANLVLPGRPDRMTAEQVNLSLKTVQFNGADALLIVISGNTVEKPA